MNKVCVSVATHGPLRVELVCWLLATLRDYIGVAHIDLVYSTKGVQHTRNTQVLRFLRTDCTHIYFVDSDCVPHPHVIEFLARVKDPIVSTPAPQTVNGEVGLMMVDKVGTAYKYHPHKFMPCEVDAVGASGLCVAREVFDGIEKPWFEFKYDDDGLLVLGEDFHFCEKAKRAGYKVIVYPKYAQKHVKEVVLSA